MKNWNQIKDMLKKQFEIFDDDEDVVTVAIASSKNQMQPAYIYFCENEYADATKNYFIAVEADVGTMDPKKSKDFIEYVTNNLQYVGVHKDEDNFYYLTNSILLSDSTGDEEIVQNINVLCSLAIAVKELFKIH